MSSFKYLIMPIFGFIAFFQVNLDYLTESQTVILLGILGTFFGVIYNTGYIRKTGVKGATLALIAIVIWTLSVQLFYNFWQLHPTVANLFAFVGGVFVFYTLDWVMKKQPEILDSVFRIAFGYLSKRFTGSTIQPISKKTNPQNSKEVGKR